MNDFKLCFQLSTEGYSADQLQKIFLYMSKEHNIGNLEQFDDHSRAEVCVWEKNVSGCSLCKNVVSGGAVQIGDGSLGETEHGRELFTMELVRLSVFLHHLNVQNVCLHPLIILF